MFACSCNKEENEGPSTEDTTTFNIAVNNLSPFVQQEEVPEPVEQGTSGTARDDADPALECYTTTYKVAPGFDEMLAMDPTTDVIYPGAMLLGASIPTGEYIPIIAERAPITLSISLQNLSGSPLQRRLRFRRRVDSHRISADPELYRPGRTMVRIISRWTAG